MRMEKPERNIMIFMLYIFSFLLLWEWLRPLAELTETGHLGTFLMFVFISLMLSYFNARLLTASLVKVLLIAYSIHFMYFEGTFFSVGWVSQFHQSVVRNVGFMLNYEWADLTNIFRTLLFFILLWLMAYLIQYWLINRKQIFVFFLMTLIYITVLDTFTPYDADKAIVRTVVAGFAVMGMLGFYRITDREKVRKNVVSARRWMIPLVAMIVASVGIGYAAPKADPIWPDPVPFLKSYNEGSGGGGTKKVGYDTDDTTLGGPYLGDDRVVFTTEADGRHYWRIETKDIYTGKGWIQSGEGVPIHFYPEDKVPFQPFDSAIQTEEHISTVKPKKGYTHIVYPLGVKSVTPGKQLSTLEFLFNPNSEKIVSFKDGMESVIGPYTVTYSEPIYTEEQLKAANTVNPQSLSRELISRYTQLPPELPERIHELAVTLTNGKETWLEQASAIENYLRSPEFVYDQFRVGIPAEDQDYVDQFVFETQRGYCDNFSTSMIVMLRTIGIPSRWVKGYTEGEYKDTLEDGRRIYEVTNNNAHSWVEVYFPGSGWVSFEPTQGFSNAIQIETEKTTGPKTNQKDEKDPVESPSSPAKPDRPEEKENAAKKSNSLVDRVKHTAGYVKDQGKRIFWALLITGAVTAVLFKFRAKWIPHYYILRFKYKKQDKYLEKAYLALLHQLQLYGLKKDEGQTLREYALYVDEFFSSKDMRRLTSKYEEYLYRGRMDAGTWNEVKKHWEYLIKKASA